MIVQQAESLPERAPAPATVSVLIFGHLGNGWFQDLGTPKCQELHSPCGWRRN